MFSCQGTYSRVFLYCTYIVPQFAPEVKHYLHIFIRQIAQMWVQMFSTLMGKMVDGVRA